MLLPRIAENFMLRLSFFFYFGDKKRMAFKSSIYICTFMPYRFWAYSTPLLRSTTERCPLLRKLYKALLWCKTTRKEIEWGWGLKLLGPFFQKNCPFFHNKVRFLGNIERCPKFPEYVLQLLYYFDLASYSQNRGKDTH